MGPQVSVLRCWAVSGFVLWFDKPSTLSFPLANGSDKLEKLISILYVIVRLFRSKSEVIEISILIGHLAFRSAQMYQRSVCIRRDVVIRLYPSCQYSRYSSGFSSHVHEM